ncbi:MAG TPA: hypothetical protein VGS07_13545 [Thermoanaerobaculia bacterium]|jgi:hypothetical protein|nr:hypothetical protein [Thermoanaerobaculia bacterium]
MPQDEKSLVDQTIELRSVHREQSEDPWGVFTDLMEEIAAGRGHEGLEEENAAADASAHPAHEQSNGWSIFYKQNFKDRKYPRAQAFLNTSEARALLPSNYAYGTSIFLKYDPFSVRLLHLFDSSRFLYFQTEPAWSEAQWQCWRDPARQRELLSWRKSAAERWVISSELRQLAAKYQSFLVPAGTMGEKQAPPALGLREFLDLWLQKLERDVNSERPKNPLKTAFADFSLLDLFDLSYLFELRQHGQKLRDFVKETTSLAQRKGGSYLRMLSPGEGAFELLRPHWVAEGLIDRIVTFPVACQGFDTREEGADDVLFVGFLLREESGVHLEGESRLRALVSLITSTSLNELRRLQVLAEARHSAVAAIMGRNLSHNIGSHVLHWMIRREEESFKELKNSPPERLAWMGLIDAIPERVHFLGYLRERMDYIATVTRRLAWWSYSSPLSALVAPLLQIEGAPPEFELLLSNIGRSDGIGNVTIEVQDAGELSFQRLNVALPHGAAGRQAFFTILENIVRNSAKHQPVRTGNRTLTLAIEEVPEHPDLVKMIVTDGVTPSDSETMLNIREALHDPICDLQGRPKMKQLGFKEMRISAAFLRTIEPDQADDFHDPELITLEDSSDCLAHVFYMLKSRDLLVITTMGADNSAGLKRLRDLGIGVIRPGEEAFLAALRYRFTVLLDENDSMVQSWAEGAFGPDHLLPVRSFRVHSRPLDKQGRKMNETEARKIGLLLQRALETEGDKLSWHLKEEVYDLWLKSNFHERSEVQVAVFGLGASWVGSCKNGLAFDRKLLEKGGDPDEMSKLLSGFLSDCSKFDPERPIAIFAHHGTLTNLEAVCQNSKVVFAQGWSGSSATGGFLIQSPEPSTREFVLRELQEAVLARVLIIDERLASDPPGSPARRTSSCAGIELIGPEFLDLVAANPEVCIEWPSWLRTRSFDYASIHFGLIEKSYKKFKSLAFDDFVKIILDQLKNVARVVMVHSGRGRPILPSTVSGIRHVDFSSLMAWLNEDKRTLVIGLGGL